MRQADQQLRGYAARLASRPFVVTPFSGVGPGALGAAAAGGSGYGIDVLGPAGQLVLGTGLGRRPGTGQPGPVAPPVSARTATRPGQVVTVSAAGGASWRVIAEPIHYRARHIPFGYSAEDFALLVTGQARPGLAGTLVVGLDLDGIGQVIGRLAVVSLVLSGLAIAAVAWLSMAAVRRILGGR
jgi:hypothetical protein